MIDYMIWEAANGAVLEFDMDIYPITQFHPQYESRNDETAKVQQDGIWQTYDYLGKMELTIEGDIVGDSPADYWLKRMAIASIFVPAAQLGFKYTTILRVQPTGFPEEVQCACQLDGRPDIPINSEYPAQGTFQINLKAADPRFYASNQQTATAGDPASSNPGLQLPLVLPLNLGGVTTGGDVFLTNAGNAYTAPVVQIVGACSSPELTLYNDDGTTTTLALSANGGLNVAESDTVTVDFTNRTVTNQDGANLFQYATGTWWQLAPLSINHVKFNATNTSTSCGATFTWSNAYLL